MVIVFSILILFNSSCGKDESNKLPANFNNCDSINKVDALINAILNKRYAYTFIIGDTIKSKYLISNRFINSGKKFIGIDSIPIYTINKDSVENETISKFVFYDEFFNPDTTNAILKVDYLANGWKDTKTIIFKCTFNNITCSWNLKDSAIILY